MPKEIKRKQIHAKSRARRGLPPVAEAVKEAEKVLGKKRKSNAGRPTVMTKETIGKLEIAFGYGASDEEACSYADISMDTLYEYQKKHPEFSELKVRLKERPTMMAREAVVRSFKTYPGLAMKYLKAKKNKEFREAMVIDNTNSDKLKEADTLLDEIRSKSRTKTTPKKSS